jgi:2'-5' RNA ligase
VVEYKAKRSEPALQQHVLTTGDRVLHRLFVAIRPPRHVRERLLATMGGVPGARWQTDDQLHLTLRFIGEVDHHRAGDVAAALGSVHHPALTLALDGFGAFDRKGYFDTLWAGVTPHDHLRTLHNKIDQALAGIGLPPEGRAYRPHITLARFSRGKRPVTSPLPPQLLPISTSFEACDFCLFESELGTGGAVYSIVARYPLM